jgi:transglutaminase/protease-like cytokinesis protein 3
MIISHLPDRSGWQLLPHSIDRSSFEDLPILEPEFIRDKLQIISPVKYQTKVRGTASIEIKSSQGYEGVITAIFSQDEENQKDMARCQNQLIVGGMTKISCQFPNKGDYIVSLYKNEEVYLGKLKFTVF